MGFKEFFVKPPVAETTPNGFKLVTHTVWQALIYPDLLDSLMDSAIAHNESLLQIMQDQEEEDKKKAFEDSVRKIVREELMKIKQAAPAPAPKVDQKPARAKKVARQRKQK